jgi:hypothetical protein
LRTTQGGTSTVSVRGAAPGAFRRPDALHHRRDRVNPRGPPAATIRMIPVGIVT